MQPKNKGLIMIPKVKVIVFTQKTRLPVAIQRCVEAFGSTLDLQVVEAPEPADLQKLLARANPSYVVVDGGYKPTDARRWSALSALDVNALRLKLLQNNVDVIPESLRQLNLIFAAKPQNTKVAIFIDNPSDVLVTELKRLGASFVHRSLNRITDNEASLFKAIQGGKSIVDGLRQIGRAILSPGKE